LPILLPARAGGRRRARRSNSQTGGWRDRGRGFFPGPAEAVRYTPVALALLAGATIGLGVLPGLPDTEGPFRAARERDRTVGANWLGVGAALGLVVAVAACRADEGPAAEVAKLRARVQELEAENKALRAEVA